VGFNGVGDVMSKGQARTEVENCPQYENSVSKVEQLAGGSKDRECKAVIRESEECTFARLCMEAQQYIRHEE